MNGMETNYRQRFLQPIQQIALQKQPYQINGVQFFCQQSYYEGQLLNGIDLKVKQLKGLNPNPNLIDYLPDSQQLIFSASSSLVTHNTHKKNYHQLLTLEGEVTFLKVHFDKNNSRQYIMWIEKRLNVKESSFSFSKTNLKKYGSLSKRKEIQFQEQQDKPDFFKSLLSNFMNKNFQSQKNQNVESNFTYSLKIFDFSKKELIFQRDILLKDETIKDLFMFMGTFKMAGYIVEKQGEKHRLFYKQMAKKQTKVGFVEFQVDKFESIQLQQNIKHLKFNTEQFNYVFFDDKTFYCLYPQEVKAPENSSNPFENLIFQHLQDSINKPTTLSVCIKRKAEFQIQILGLAFNDQYLAILTHNKIYFHSAFDTACLIFIHQLQDTTYFPSGIEFNKSFLYMTYKNFPKISTFTLKSRSLRHINTTELQLQHCKQIYKIFSNSISSELFCVIMFYEIQSRANNKNSGKYQPNIVQYVIKPAFVDVSASFLSPSSKTQAKILNIAKQKYQKLHTCPWLSTYIIQAQSQVTFGLWKQSFQNKKCLCLHPSGIYMVVCFKDAFKIYVISFDGLVNTFLGDSLNDIQACAISSLGHHLAIITNNLIIIYDFYSCKKNRVITLPIGSTVESLWYVEYTLCCFLKNKKFYAFDSFDNYREIVAFNPKSFILQSSNEEVNLQNTNNLTYQLLNYISLRTVFYDPNLELILFSVKNNLYFYNCRSNSIMMTAQMNTITAFHYCRELKILFLGTEDGELLSYSWPNKPASFVTDQRKFKLHGGQIISIVVSSDLKEVVTLADDNSLCICELIYVQNLKRMQGLELIEYLANNVTITYDILSRRGIYQYTHSKFNQKQDLIKDFEEQAQNMNFILPQQRLKQKQCMLSNINDQKKLKLFKADQEYFELNRMVEEVKQRNNKMRQTMNQTETKIGVSLQETKTNNLNEYLGRYNTTQQSHQQLVILKSRYKQQKQELSKELNIKLQEQKQSYNKQLIVLQQKFINQKNAHPKYFFQQLQQIEEQKKEFITQNVDNLKKMIANYHTSNGALSCKINNIEKQISQLKKRLEQRRYLLERLQETSKVLTEEQKKYEQTKQQKQKRVAKEDKVNLAEIQKLYVKQTKVLIQKDKEITILTTNYNKQKQTLIYLEKLLQTLEGSIQQVVQNILEQKEIAKKLIKQIQKIKSQFSTLNSRNMDRKKDRTYIKNNLNNFIYSIQLVLNEIIASNKDSIKNIIVSKQLFTIDQIQRMDKKNEEVYFQEARESKLYDYGQSSDESKDKIAASLQRKSVTCRKCITQGKEDLFTTREKKITDLAYIQNLKQENIQKGSKKVLQKLKSESKIFQRIKTQQIVYENRQKKIGIQNEDLIENYNTVIMQNKKIENLMKRKESLSKISFKKMVQKKMIQNNPTPFQRYLENKTANSKRLKKIAVPSHSYSIDS